MVRYDAEIRGWTTYRCSGFVVVVGRVYGDLKGRWPDGRMIQTSALLTPKTAKEGNVVATMNSHYLLSGPKRALAELLNEGEQERAIRWTGRD